MRFGVMVAVALVVGANVACSDTPTSGNRTSATQVTVGDNYFNPTDVTVAVGDTVAWIWGGSAAHNVIFGVSGAPAPCDPPQSSGICFRKFLTAGTFNYACTLHAGMVGSVTVQ